MLLGWPDFWEAFPRIHRLPTEAGLDSTNPPVRFQRGFEPHFFPRSSRAGHDLPACSGVTSGGIRDYGPAMLMKCLRFLPATWVLLSLGGSLLKTLAAPPEPAPQRFEQEVASRYPAEELDRTAQLLELGPGGRPRMFAGGQWYELQNQNWEVLPGLKSERREEFVFPGPTGNPVHVQLPWKDVQQILRHDQSTWLATPADPFAVVEGQARSLGWPSRFRVHQLAVGADGTLWVASSGGLFHQVPDGWAPMKILDGVGRLWATQQVLGVAFDSLGQLWFACTAGVGCQTREGWRFYEGRDGLPWNDFTGIAPGPDGTVWFGTRLGAIRRDASGWAYRQGPRWWPDDQLRQMAVDPAGNAWAITGQGVGVIRRRAMTLGEKAALYESEIEKYIKRTPLGYVAEAGLKTRGDRSSANPGDSDNDGLWTAMYGAGECFAVGATGDPIARRRARQAFEALRFLQKVTQGGPHAPPKGYVARTIRSVELPDPNQGRREADLAGQRHDALWKVYEPRWPKSADGEWYWKSDTSSDELDGHYFFYPLYHEFCAETPEEKQRVREVVRELTDHLIEHEFTLTDHDGQPTRWGVFGPKQLNHDPHWWAERGLNSLSMLCYLAVAHHMTGDQKYADVSRRLIDEHGYAHNAMYPKIQHGPGSGNQSDDEMAFMCFYGLLRYSHDESLKALIRYSFYRYWANEFPEQNPFFNFAYAAHNLGQSAANPFGTFDITPWAGWQEESMVTLRGFPLDRLNWPHRNSHRLDLQFLWAQGSIDLYEPRRRQRGHRVNGRVLPVENRHFNHWNTDPWQLDYGGDGGELAAGTVFLLPYYLGLYHGFIAKP